MNLSVKGLYNSISQFKLSKTNVSQWNVSVNRFVKQISQLISMSNTREGRLPKETARETPDCSYRIAGWIAEVTFYPSQVGSQPGSSSSSSR